MRRWTKEGTGGGEKKIVDAGDEEGRVGRRKRGTLKKRGEEKKGYVLPPGGRGFRVP